MRQSTNNILCNDTMLYYTIFDDEVKIHMLHVPKKLRGQGLGTQLLREKIEEIREMTSLPIVLEAFPLGDSDMTVAQLVRWYEARGFYHDDSDKDSHAITMVYEY